MTPEQESALRVLRNELLDSIDGSEECRGRDTQLSRWIALCELAMGEPIEPWMALALKPDLDTGEGNEMSDKPFPALCMGCKHAKPERQSTWAHRCFHPKVVGQDAWALSNNNEGKPYGSSCREERARRAPWAPCGMRAKLWEAP